MSMSDKKRDPKVYADFNLLMAMQHKAAGLSFLPRHAVQSILSGRHASKLRGRGLNFEELRHYRTGDDIRTLDWKVTNRTKKPHVRVYTEERERRVLMIVDQRISMFFGSKVKMKSVAAAEMAALCAWRTLAVGDRIGALLFNDSEIKEIRPQRSRPTAQRILFECSKMNHALHAHQKNAPNEQQLANTLVEAERLCGHDCLVVVISDLAGWSEGVLGSIRRLSVHNDVIVPFVFDPLEKHLPEKDSLVVSDGSVQIEVDARKSALKEQFTAEFSSSFDTVQNELKKYGVPVIPIDTVQPVEEQLRHALGLS